MGGGGGGEERDALYMGGGVGGDREACGTMYDDVLVICLIQVRN